MNDPLPENIEGVVTEDHSFEHQMQHSFDWGQIALGLGIVAIAYVLWSAFEPGESVDGSEETDGGGFEEPVL